MTNCIIANNFASEYGGAFYNYLSSPILINCTLSGNANSYDEGGGMYNEYKSSPVITNSILWENSSLPIVNDSSTSNPVITYTDIQYGYAGTGNIDADPLFIRLPYVGVDGDWERPTTTMATSASKSPPPA